MGNEIAVGKRIWSRRHLVDSGIAGAALLAACGPLRPRAPAAVRPATIRFTYWGADPDEVQVQDRVIAAFAPKFPQVRVENEGDAAGTGPYHDKLLVQQAAGTVPDVVRINSVNMPRFAMAGALLALDELIRRDRYDLNDFWAAALPLNRYQQKLYTLPVIGGPNPLFWNGRLFREAGLAPATEQEARGQWTWDRFADAARRLTQREGDTFRVAGFTVDLTWGGLSTFLWSAGGDYFNSDRTKCVLTEAPALEAVQFMADLFNKHQVAPRPGEPATGLQWFPSGTIAMQIQPMTSSYRWRQDPQFEFDVVLNPRGRGGQIGRLNANGYGLLAGTKEQDAAWAFLQHVAGPDTLSYLAAIGRSFPWRRSVAQSREYRESQPIRTLDVLFKLADKQGRAWPIVPTWTEIERFANGQLREIAQGKLSVREGLQRIKDEADRLLVS